VNDWCTAATSPPDNSFNGAKIGQTLPNALPTFWDTVSPCIRFIGTSTWTCGHGIASSRLLKNAFHGSWRLAGAKARSASRALTRR
jgi:hypothetical protein